MSETEKSSEKKKEKKKKLTLSQIMNFLKILGQLAGNMAPIVRLALIVFGCLAITLYVKDVKNAHKGDIETFIAKDKEYEKSLAHAMNLVEKKMLEVKALHDTIKINEEKNKQIQKQLQSTIASTERNKKKAEVLANELQDSTITLQDSVEILIEIIPVKDSIIETQGITIQLQAKNMKVDSSTIINQNKIITNLRFSVDSLRDAIKKKPEPPKSQKFLNIIPYPSRKTSFVFGAVTGAFLVGGIVKR